MKKGVKVLLLSSIVIFAVYFVSMVAFDSYSIITGSAVEEGYCSGGNIPQCESFSYTMFKVIICLFFPNLFFNNH